MFVTLRKLKDYCSSFLQCRLVVLFRYGAFEWKNHSFSWCETDMSPKHFIKHCIRRNYRIQSSLLAVRDDSQERRLRNCQFHTDVVKSLIYESGQERYCSRMENKRSKRWVEPRGIHSSLEEAFEAIIWVFLDLAHRSARNVTIIDREKHKLNKSQWGTPWPLDKLRKHWFTSSVWNFCRWGKPKRP